MHTDELLPRRRGLTLRSRGEAVTLQDVAHGLVTDGVPEVGQGADDPVVAPGAILWGLALLGAIKLLRHELAVPAEDGVGFDDLRHFLQGMLPQFLANLG